MTIFTGKPISGQHAGDEQVGSYTGANQVVVSGYNSTDWWGIVNISAVSIPAGSTINSASIEFTVKDATISSFDLVSNIYGDDVDSSADNTAGTGGSKISSRALTTATAPWSVIDTGYSIGDKVTTPDLAAIVQEIVNRAGWASGNNLSIIFNAAATGQYHHFWAFNGAAAANLPELTIDFTEPGGGGGGSTISAYPIQNSDSLQEQAGAWITSQRLQLGGFGNNYWNGIRFAGVAIPVGATITDAYVQLSAKGTASGGFSTLVRADDVADSLTFSSLATAPSTRPITTATVPWNQAGTIWTDLDRTADQRSPDISAVIQEIVNNSGWATGNDISILIQEAGSPIHEAYSYESAPSASERPELVVTYSTTGGGTTVLAVSDTYVTTVDQPLTIPSPGVLQNDSGATITVDVGNSATTSTAGGSVSWAGNTGGFTYTPVNGYTGSDQFNYQITDGTDTSIATVTFTVNSNPVGAVDDNYSTEQDEPLNISAPGVLTNDTSTSAGGDAGHGMNSGPFGRFGSDRPMADKFVEGNGWFVNGGGTRLTDLQLDANGWPTSMGGGSKVTWYLSEARPWKDGTYVLLWDGLGVYGTDITISAGAVSSTSVGRAEVTFSNVSNTFAVDINNITSDYIRNIRLVEIGLESAYAVHPWTSSAYKSLSTSELFDPDYVNKMFAHSFKYWRIMDWVGINRASGPVGADIQHTATAANQSTVNRPDWRRRQGVPVEIIVEFCNRFSVNPIINIPVLAYDTSITGGDSWLSDFVSYIRDNLSASLVAIYEYDNEIWNYAYPFALKTNFVGDNAPFSVGTHPGLDSGSRVDYGYGQRSFEIFGEIQTIYGGTTNYDFLWAGHLKEIGRMSRRLDGDAGQNWGATRGGYVSSSGYFGPTMSANGAGSLGSRNSFQMLASKYDTIGLNGAIQWLFDVLTTGSDPDTGAVPVWTGSPDSTQSTTFDTIPETLARMQSFADASDARGMAGLLVYEFNCHATVYGHDGSFGSANSNQKVWSIIHGLYNNPTLSKQMFDQIHSWFEQASNRVGFCAFYWMFPPKNDELFTVYDNAFDTNVRGIASSLLELAGGSSSSGALTVSSSDTATSGGGTTSVLSNGQFSYTPAAGYTGTDSFQYTATNGVDTSTATVFINVTAPAIVTTIANGDVYDAFSGESLTVSAPGVLANDSNGGAGALTVSAFDSTSAQNGSVVVYSTGRFVYAPAAGFVGTDTFQYTATNGTTTATATVTITVSASVLNTITPRRDTVDEAPASALTRTVEYLVGALSDDASESGAGGVSLSLATAGGNDTTGFRFTGVEFPKGAQATSAEIIFTNTGSLSGTTTWSIAIEDTAHADTYVAGQTSDITSRDYLGTTVAWSTDFSSGTRGANQTTPNLVAMVQSIIDRPDWTSGGAMAFKFAYQSGTPTTMAAADTSSVYAGQQEITDLPTLRITYTAPSTLGDECFDGVWMVEFRTKDPDTGAQQTHRYVDRPWEMPPSSALLGNIEARVQQSFSISRSIFSSSEPFAARATARVGVITIENKDGALDGLISQIFEDESVTIFHIPTATSPFEDAVVRYVGTMGRPQFVGDVITLALNDQHGGLNQPAQSETVLSEAWPASRGDLRPVLVGAVKKIPGKRINKRRFLLSDQSHDLVIRSVWDGNITTDYVQQEMKNDKNVIIRLDEKPQNEVRFNVDADTPYLNTVAGSIQQLLDGADVETPRDGNSFAQLELDAPYKAGYWAGSEETVHDVLTALCESAGAFYSQTSRGEIRVKQLRAAAGQAPKAIFTDGNTIGEIKLVERRPAYTKFRVGHSYNSRPIKVLDDGVEPDFIRGELSIENAYSTMTLPTTNKWPDREKSVTGHLYNAESAGIEAVRRLGLHGKATRYVKCSAPTASSYLEIGDPVQVFSFRDGLENGDDFVILEMTEGARGNKTDFILWDGADALLDTPYTANSLRVDDTGGTSFVSARATTGLPATNSKLITFAGDFKWNSSVASAQQFLTVRNAGDVKVQVLITPQGRIRIIGNSPNGTPITDVAWYLDTNLEDLGWFHVYLGVDGSDQEKMFCFINGGDISDDVVVRTFETGIGNWDWSGDEMFAGSHTTPGNARSLHNMNLSSMWINNEYHPDLVDKYLDQNNRLLDLGANGENVTGSSPLINLRPGISAGGTWTNSGTAGNFTVTGGSRSASTDSPTIAGV